MTTSDTITAPFTIAQVDASPGTALIARLEQAADPDRTLDLAISVAINFKGVLIDLARGSRRRRFAR